MEVNTHRTLSQDMFLHEWVPCVLCVYFTLLRNCRARWQKQCFPTLRLEGCRLKPVRKILWFFYLLMSATTFVCTWVFWMKQAACHSLLGSSHSRVWPNQGNNRCDSQHSKNTLSIHLSSWEIDGETVETVSDFIFWGSKITADADCSHEIKRRLLLGRKVMTNLDSILKSIDITLPTKVCLVKAMVFPVVMYGCESWTVKKAECWKIDAFELWCWRRLLRVPWTARRSNQSILKEISPGWSLEGMMLKLKL